MTQYAPENVSHPGATLAELLETKHMSQAELAERTGRPKKLINEIIRGKAAITPETAIQLELVLGVSASFWNNREARYREFLARELERKNLDRFSHWTSNFPIAAMRRSGWFEPAIAGPEALQTLLKFFGVVSPEQWESVWAVKQAAFRKSPAFESNWFATTVWLRKGEIESQLVECGEFDAAKFRQTLSACRELTTLSAPDAKQRLRDLCKAAGVAVVFVPELPGTRVSGATHWLSPQKALIQMSGRYQKDDHFWFTFFHEAAHILFHGKREFFIEDDREGASKSESEADEFSRNFLIPEPAYESFLRRGGINAFRIREFAREIGIAPGIVVGRLQREKVLPYTTLNGLKARYSA